MILTLARLGHWDRRVSLLEECGIDKPMGVFDPFPFSSVRLPAYQIHHRPLQFRHHHWPLSGLSVERRHPLPRHHRWSHPNWLRWYSHLKEALQTQSSMIRWCTRFLLSSFEPRADEKLGRIECCALHESRNTRRIWLAFRFRKKKNTFE